MTNKTCGECKHFSCSDEGQCMDDKWTFCDSDACNKFQSKVITNGDVIRAIVDNKKFAYYICEVSTKHKLFTADDLAEWLNAPAESEGER